MTPASPTRVTLTTYNIHHAAGMDKKVDVPRIASVLKDAGAQIVCLQEVDDRVVRSGLKRQPRELAKLLDMEPAYGPTLHWPVGARYGNAILSALPILSTQEHLLPGKEEQRGLLETRLQTPAGPIAVFCTHLGLTAEDRASQTDRIMEILGACDVPALLAGDFNEEADGPTHATLRNAGLVLLSPDEPTFPSTGPNRRIDFVYGTSQWKSLGGRVLASLASDHCAVAVDLERPG